MHAGRMHAPVAPACLQGGFEVPRRGVIAAVQPTGSEVVLMLVRCSPPLTLPATLTPTSTPTPNANTKLSPQPGP